MDRRTAVKERMLQLRENFRPFLEECAKRGYPISQIRYREKMLVDILTGFFADVLAEWADERGPIYFAGVLENILADAVPKEKQVDFCGFNVQDTPERYNRFERPDPPYIQLTS